MIKTPFRHRGSSNSKRGIFGVAQPDAAVILGALALPVIVIDRSGGKAEVGAPRVALATLEVVAFSPEDCPLCRKGLPVVKPGSRAESGS